MMTTLQFKCTLETDVILNAKSATEGSNSTLDFIPGNCFLGIAASQLYSKDPEAAMTLFHSGKVRFGDGHPCAAGQPGIRSLRTPAAMFYPKLSKLSKELYIHPCIPDDQLDSAALRQKQLKQCRTGFYAFGETTGETTGMPPVNIRKTFAIKSAYDKDKRRSMDNCMFVYESLESGQVFLFEVALDDDAKGLSEQVKKALVGIRHVGRSKTAQYGLVKIEEFEYTEPSSSQGTGGVAMVYADSRLIFLDENGLPTLQPSVGQLGFTGGEIDWSKSQVRSFQYAPWNAKRQCYDTDRYGIEKGSVLVIKGAAGCPAQSQYVGSYQNEGFGKVIYNPSFLRADKDGKALIRLQEQKDPADGRGKEERPGGETISQGNSPLLSYIARQKKQSDDDSKIYDDVNNFVTNHGGLFTRNGDKFASQWGAIRGIAMAASDEGKIQDNIKKFIEHGVKSEDWYGSRREALKDFLSACSNDTIREAVINLASQMAKKCKSNK